MITIFNHSFSTPNKPSSVSFPLFNEGQLVTHAFNIGFDYNFNSTPQNQIIITGLNEITMLNGSFTNLGVVVGDSLDLDAIVSGDLDINVTSTVQSINGSVLVFESNVFNANEINQSFPLGNNSQMFIVNNTRQSPESIDIYYNLIQNNAAATNNSLWDSEVNRFTATLPTVVGTYPMTQIGNKSGGTFVNSEIILTAGVYSVRFTFIPWLSYEQDNLDLPTWYNGGLCIKPVINIIGFSQIGNPNNTISGGQSAWLGNTGWFNESYNQGNDNFILSDLVAPNVLSANNLNSISFKIENTLSAVDTNIQISLTSVFPDSETKNNSFNRFENQLGVIYTGVNNYFTSKNGAECEVSNVIITASGNDILVSFDIEPNSNFTQYIQSQNQDVYYRLAINVNGLGQFNNVSKVISEGVWGVTPTPPTELQDAKSGFLDHSQLPIGGYTVNYDGCTEDDMLFVGEIVFLKNTNYNNVRLAIEVIRDSDSSLVATLQQIIFNLTNVPILNGVYQLNFNTPFNQFLDSDGRNSATLTLGNETSTTYVVNYKYSLMANWRDWIALTNLLPDFYDFNLPQNGQSAEWVNYLRLAGYSIKLRLELNGLNQEFLTRNIDLLDYDESDNMTTEIQVLDSFGNVVPSVLNNQIYTIRAIHTTTGVWSERPWGWIGIRPSESEPMKRISTTYDWSAQNLPLQPLTNQTRALLTQISPTVVHVECQINSNEISGLSTIVARIHDYE